MLSEDGMRELIKSLDNVVQALQKTSTAIWSLEFKLSQELAKMEAKKKHA